MAVYSKHLPAAIPGTLTRDFKVVESAVIEENSDFSFGQTAVLEDEKFRPFSSGDTVEDLYGILARSIPLAQSRLVQDRPNPKLILGVLVMGYIGVLCKNGTPTRGGKVFIRLVDVGEYLAGELETDFIYEIVEDDIPEGITLGGFSVNEIAQAGQYSLHFTGEYFDCYLPDGTFVGAGKIAEEFSAAGISFLVTGAVPPDNSIALFTVVKITDLVPNFRWSLAGKDEEDRAEIFIR